jgi:LacI family transcriptional regulator
MPSQLAEKTRIVTLAKRLEADLLARGYRPGDRYRTSIDTGRFLGVSPATAHRAMELLVRRNLLSRRQGAGTFVGSSLKSSPKLEVKTIFVLMEERQRNVTNIVLDDLMQALAGVFPGAGVQFSFLPERNGVEFVRAVITPAQEAGQFAGVVAISCPRDVYRVLAECRVPLVVMGSLYPDQQDIPSLDMDYRQAAQLLASHLVGRGHRRMAMLTTGGGRPGDGVFYDGLSDVLTEANLPHNALTVRTFAHDFDAFDAQVRQLLDSPNRPTGWICASDKLVNSVCRSAASLGLTVGKDLEIVFQDEGQSNLSAEHRAMAHVQPNIDFFDMTKIIADLLRKQAEGQPLTQRRIIIPSRLCTASDDRM